MKEYMIHTDTPGIEFGVIADNEAEAREVAQDILNLTIVTRVVEDSHRSFPAEKL